MICPWIAPKSRICSSLLLIGLLGLTSACTFYANRPARSFADATGGEGLERVFWKQVAAGNWTDIDRVLASNYVGITPKGPIDRGATLEQYKQWKVKDYSIGNVATTLNGSTIVVTYTISLSGTVGDQTLPTEPQHMMTV